MDRVGLILRVGVTPSLLRHAAGAFRHAEIATTQAKKPGMGRKIGIICLTCLNLP